MNVSLNWLKDYLEISLTPAEIADKLTQLGLETTFEGSGKSFTGVILGKVLECESHPNADKLSVCTVDIGDGETYSIVCGAPNVRKGIHVPVAKVGATLQNGEFKIKKAKLRGVVSNGMICSGKELAINDDHEGILILDTDEELGTSIEKILNFNEDVLFDLDLTPNRGDCLSHLGVARELGIIEKQEVSRRKSELKEGNGEAADEISVNIDAPDGCPRYAARVIKGVKVAPSPQWLVKRLKSVGLSSINNIVDAANYVLMDSGHPMHTFDLSKVAGKEINVRFAKEGEKFITLDGIERELKDFHLLICDKKKPIALAGIMGGINSEINDVTTDILLESAYFDPRVVRKGAKILDLSTEASKRFERDTDIDGVIPALDQLAALIKDLTGGEILQGAVDYYQKHQKLKQVSFSPEKCQALLGTEISNQEIGRIFRSLQIDQDKKYGSIHCTIPSFRNDLEREVDLIEEIARVTGYDNIPATSQFKGSFESFVDDEQELDMKLRLHLQTNGFNEHYSNSLFSEKYTSHFQDGQAVEIKNPISQDMAYVRNSILPGLLIAASYNEKRQERGFKLFEIGAVHTQTKKSKTKSFEKFHLGILWYGESAPHWRNNGKGDIFRFKGEIRHLLETFGLSGIHFKLEKIEGFLIALNLFSKKNQLGILGIPNQNMLEYYDLKLAPAVCDISLNLLRKLWNNREFNYQTPNPYPSVMRDIAVQIERDIPAGDLLHTIHKEGGEILKNVTIFDEYQSEDVGDQDKSLAFSLKFQAESKTLKDSEVDQVLARILESLKKGYGAIQR